MSTAELREQIKRKIDRLPARDLKKVADMISTVSPPSFSTKQELEALLLEGLNSGPGIVADAKYWREEKARLKRTLRRTPRK